MLNRNNLQIIFQISNLSRMSLFFDQFTSLGNIEEGLSCFVVALSYSEEEESWLNKRFQVMDEIH